MLMCFLLQLFCVFLAATTADMKWVPIGNQEEEARL